MAGEEWLAAGVMHYWWESLINWKYPLQQGRMYECVGVCVCGWSKWLHFVWTTSSVSAQHSVLIVILHRHTLPNIYCMCNHKYGRSKWYYSHKHSPRGTMGIITLGNLHNVSWYYTMADICVGRLRALCISLDAGLLHLQHTGRVVWIKDEAVKRWTTGPKTN